MSGNVATAMRTHFLLAVCLALTLAHGVDIKDLKSAESIPPAARIWFQHLAQYDIRETELEEMSHVPSVSPALVELAQALIAEKADFEHLYFVLDAILMRNDLSEEHQAWFRSQLEPMIGLTPNGIIRVFKQRGLIILSGYPGKENEELLIKYLVDRNGESDPIGFSSIAAEGLGKIGTQLSIGPLQIFAARFKPKPGYSDFYFDCAVASIAAIQARMHAPSGVSTHEAGGLKSPAKAKVNANQKDSPKVEDETDASMPWSVLALLVAASVCLVWLLLRGRK